MIVDDIEETNARKEAEFERERERNESTRSENLPSYSQVDPLQRSPEQLGEPTRPISTSHSSRESLPRAGSSHNSYNSRNREAQSTSRSKSQAHKETSSTVQVSATTRVYISPPELYPVTISYDDRPVRPHSRTITYSGLGRPHYIQSKRTQHLSTTMVMLVPRRPFSLPRPIPEYDIFESDWIRFMNDIEKATTLSRQEKIVSMGATVNVAASAVELEVRKSKISEVALVIKQWNILFFLPRQLDVFLAKGQRRFSGPFRSLDAHRSEYDTSAPLLSGDRPTAVEDGREEEEAQSLASYDSRSLASGSGNATPTFDSMASTSSTTATTSRMSSLASSIAPSSIDTIKNTFTRLTTRSADDSQRVLRYSSYYRIVVMPLS